MQLRPYQAEDKAKIYNAWNSGAKNVLLVEATGAGKTVIFSEIMKEHVGASCAIAHRQELVSQISLALARDGVRHKIIGPKKVVRLCVNNHMDELGVSYYDPSSPVAVAGVDTLVRRYDELKHWLNSVTLWVQDEAHHVLKGNKWGKACAMFPNAKGLGVTATPRRADGKGLGRHADGLFDVMVEGPSMRELINAGYLTDYRIFAPKTKDLDFTNVAISKKTGDLIPAQQKTAFKKSNKIIGDIVDHYLRHARGKLGITFVPGVDIAIDVAKAYNDSGVPAAVVSAKTSDADRISILRRFKNRELLQLVNVDLFGEGFDLPSISVVSMARKTKSYGLYVQQFGRGLRLMDGKTEAIIIDHVGNVDPDIGGHGLPDARQSWTLDRREKRGKSKPTDVIPVRTCLECFSVYERTHHQCPYCGTIPVPGGRSRPEQVDGDLTELDVATLAAMRGEVDRVNLHPEAFRAELQGKYVPVIGQMAQVKIHARDQATQEALRASIAWWAGLQRAHGRDDRESYKRFYFMFGVDVMTAQTLKTADAIELAGRINEHLGELQK